MNTAIAIIWVTFILGLILYVCDYVQQRKIYFWLIMIDALIGLGSIFYILCNYPY